MTFARAFALMLATVLVLIASWRGLRSFGLGRAPLMVHNIAFAASLALYGLPLIEYDDVSAQGWFVIVTGLGGFNLGCAARLALRRPREPALAPESRPASRSLVFTWLVPLGFFIGAALYARAIQQTFGIGQLIANPSSVRSELGETAFLSQYSLVARSLYGLGPLCLVCFAVPRISGVAGGRAVRGAVIAATVAGLSLSLGRTLLLIALIWAAFALTLAGATGRGLARLGRRRRRNIAIGLVGGVVLFQLVAVVLGKTGAEDLRLQRYVAGPLRGSALTSAVVYLSGPIPAFSDLVDLESGIAPGSVDVGAAPVVGTVDTGPYWGLAQLGALAKMAGAEPPEDVRPFTATPLPFNAYTYLDAPWLDARLAGVLLGTFGLGFAITAVASRRVRTARDLLLPSLLLTLVCWTPFGFKFTETFVVVTYGILLLDRMVRRRRPGTTRPTGGPGTGAGNRTVAEQSGPPTPARPSVPAPTGSSH